MPYKDLFNRFGTITEHSELRLNIYLTRPDKLEDTRRVRSADESAERYIKELEKVVEDLKEYRQALAARYGELETMSYHDILTLERKPYRTPIAYDIEIKRVFEDKTENRVLFEHYEGKDRHNALKRFNELRKQHPGIEAVKDIEKRHWER